MAVHFDDFGSSGVNVERGFRASLERTTHFGS